MGELEPQAMGGCGLLPFLWGKPQFKSEKEDENFLRRQAGRKMAHLLREMFSGNQMSLSNRLQSQRVLRGAHDLCHHLSLRAHLGMPSSSTRPLWSSSWSLPSQRPMAQNTNTRSPLSWTVWPCILVKQYPSNTEGWKSCGLSQYCQVYKKQQTLSHVLGILLKGWLCIWKDIISSKQ